MKPIYVPSKGRAGKSPVIDRMLAEGARLFVVVTYDDFDVYVAQYGAGLDFIIQDRPGIAGARQAILEHARYAGFDWVWMLDDDTTALHVRDEVERRYGAALAEWGPAMTEMEGWAQFVQGGERLAMAGPAFRQFGWGAESIEPNQHLRNFILLRPDVPADYWPMVKEDLDFTLQLLTSGWQTMRMAHWGFQAPAMGTIVGGCMEDYAAGALIDATYALETRWPGLVRAVVTGDAQFPVESRVAWARLRKGDFAGVTPVPVKDIA